MIAGILYFLEFFADKIPWVDSAWDAVHTVIRPIGGALLAIRVLGHPNPTFDVIVLLLAGGTSLIAHTAKASTRLVANTSPEPFSNIGLSLGRRCRSLRRARAHSLQSDRRSVDFRARASPRSFISRQKFCARMKAKIWLIFKKLKCPAGMLARRTKLCRNHFPSKLARIFARQNVLSETIAWAVPCISGRGRRIPANLFGALVATNEEPRKLIFVARKKGRGFAQTIDLDGLTIAREPKFLSENLTVFAAAAKVRNIFSFSRAQWRRGGGRGRFAGPVECASLAC